MTRGISSNAKKKEYWKNIQHGKFVEHGSADSVILAPQEPYTKRLIRDVPKIHEPWDLDTLV